MSHRWLTVFLDFPAAAFGSGVAGDGGCHLDLHVGTATEPLAGAAERARSLRAREITKQERWTVLADPANREYCLVHRPPIA
jgi:hypothetical protein